MTSQNLLAWAAQVLLCVSTGALLPRLFGLREPRVLLRYFQLLLLACLLLPACQPWLHPVFLVPAAAFDGPTSTAALPPVPARAVHLEDVVLPALAAGAVLRLLWLVLGFWRLHRYRLSAAPVHPLPDAVTAALRQTAAAAEIKLSAEVPGPVTFGAHRPVVLLPEAFLALPGDAQLAVACHELLHVKRRDWTAGVLEEIAVSLLWFHPAVLWLAGQIRLAREKAVDAEVVRLTGAHEPYVQALLELGPNRPRLNYVPAQPFLTRSHIVQRVESLVRGKESTMSKRRLYSSFSAIAAALAVTTWISVLVFPLTGTPQVKESPRPDAAGVTVDTGTKVLHRSPVDYPEAARRKGIQGTVVVALTLAQDGTVTDGSVLSGPEELRAAALKSALDWHYAPGAPEVRVAMEFRLPEKNSAAPNPAEPGKPPAEVLALDLTSVPESLQPALRDRLGRYEGQPATLELRRDAEREVAAVDSHLNVFWRVSPADKKYIIAPRLDSWTPDAAPSTTFAVAKDRIRIGGNVQSAKVTHMERPLYPPLAKMAKIQGVVRLEVLIDKSGHISNLALISGHPLLVPAAMDAVKQWTYAPTWLNGQPVEVISTVDVNYTLADTPPPARE